MEGEGGDTDGGVDHRGTGKVDCWNYEGAKGGEESHAGEDPYTKEGCNRRLCEKNGERISMLAGLG